MSKSRPQGVGFADPGPNRDTVRPVFGVRTRSVVGAGNIPAVVCSGISMTSGPTVMESVSAE